MRYSVAILFLLAASSYARKPAPLPDFPLVTADGKTVSSAQLHLPNRWLLIYTQDSSHTSAVLNTLKDEPPSLLSGRILLIVGGATAKDIAPFAARYPHLNSVTWYGDPDRAALQAMNLRGAPAVLGIRQDTVQWMLTGSLPDKDRLASILKSWKNNKDK
jgi:hypothetical protein